MIRIGVLALQGDYEAHRKAIENAGVPDTVVVEVRKAEDFDDIDGLIVPGGESTTMLKLLHAEKLWDKLAAFGQNKPIFGTCAGAILMASKVSSPAQESLGLVEDLEVERNAYGRQIDSRIVHLKGEPGSGLEECTVEAVFIRAPIIHNPGAGSKVLLRYQDKPVLVEQGRHLVATFHPELTADATIHRKFLEKVRAAA